LLQLENVIQHDILENILLSHMTHCIKIHVSHETPHWLQIWVVSSMKKIESTCCNTKTSMQDVP